MQARPRRSPRSTPGAAQPLPLDASAWWNGSLIAAPARRRGRGRRGGAQQLGGETIAASRGRRRSGSGLRDHTRSVLLPPTTRSSTRRACGACRCRRPRRCSSLAGDAADRMGRRAALARDGAAGGAGARGRRRASAATRRCFAAATSRPACSRRSRRRCARSTAAEARVRPARHLQPRPAVSRSLTTSHRMQTDLAEFTGTRRRRRGRGDPAQVRALRLLHRDLPDLPAARRRARRPARPHLPDQAGARRRTRRRARRSCTSTAASPAATARRPVPRACSTATWSTSAGASSTSACRARRGERALRCGAEGRPDLAAVRAGDEGRAAGARRCCRRR